MRERTLLAVWFDGQGNVTVHETYGVGKGRHRRRQLGRTVHVPYAPTDSLPVVLRRAAAALEMSPLERWRPHA